MAGPSDTSPEAQRVLDRVHRKLPAWRKWEIVNDLHHYVRDLHAAGLARDSPSSDPGAARDDWVRRHYGDVPLPGGPTMNGPGEIALTVAYVTDVLYRLGIVYALGGSLASSIYGIARNTIDADLCVEPFPGKESVFVDQFDERFYISREAVIAAVKNRSSFNIIDTSAGFKADLFVRKDRAFEVSVLARRREIQPRDGGGRGLFVVSPEDVVLLKLEWFRLGHEVSDRQWSDVLGVLRTQAGLLDDADLDRWADTLSVRDLLTKARADASRTG
jgi:hypothetical protein